MGVHLMISQIFRNTIFKQRRIFGRVLELSKSLGKPILIQFTGYACVGYKAFELKVWPDSLVYPILKKEFIIASVYVDDRTKYPSNYESDSVSTYGEYWMNYEIARYEMVTQPIFDIINHQNESLVEGIATYPSHGEAALYKEWLEEGLANFVKE